jgi:hypothetical protein
VFVRFEVFSLEYSIVRVSRSGLLSFIFSCGLLTFRLSFKSGFLSFRFSLVQVF